MKNPSLRTSPGSALQRAGKPLRRQVGGFALGLIAGLLIGLAVALAVALYVTKAPIPFINKVPQHSAEQDAAETERNRGWDPNAPLGGKAGAHPGASSAPLAMASGATPAVAAAAPAVALTNTAAPASAPAAGAAAKPAAKPVANDPAAILAGGSSNPPADPYLYFVQTGAYTRSEDAEQQKAKLALIGQTARTTEREQAGRTVYRVRLGPFASREEADNLLAKLQEAGIEAQIVRVEKP